MEKAVLLVLLSLCASRLAGAAAQQQDWTPATATFYGKSDGSDTMGGACGYDDVYSAGGGTLTAALSTALYQNAAACGSCYAVACDASRPQYQPCKPGNVTVVATNFCPPDYNNPGGWCNSPRQHFDMSAPAFAAIGDPRAGVIYVKYRRVPCVRSGGIRFKIEGNDYFDLVTVSNVAGAGAVAAVWVMGNNDTNSKWLTMSRNWGEKWDCGAYLDGMTLSFKVQTDDGKVVVAYNVAPADWKFGSTYQSSVNF